MGPLGRGIEARRALLDYAPAGLLTIGRSERSSDARWIPNPTRFVWTCSLFGGAWQSYAH